MPKTQTDISDILHFLQSGNRKQADSIAENILSDEHAVAAAQEPLHEVQDVIHHRRFVLVKSYQEVHHELS